MRDQPSYLKEAAASPTNKLILAVGAIACVGALFRGHSWPLLVLLAIEAFVVLVLPLLPCFRASVDKRLAEERTHRRAVELEKIALRLSPNAKSRLDGINRLQGRILDAVRTLDAPEAMAAQWRVRLAELVNAALRLLVAIDTTRADGRDARFLSSEVETLASEVAKLPEGPVRAAKEQRLSVLQKRAGGATGLAEQREAAVTQLETLEDLLEDLLSQALAGRDAAAFGERLQGLSAQLDAMGDTVAALDRQAGTSAELAELKATK